MVEWIIGLAGLAFSIFSFLLGRKEGKREKAEDYLQSQSDKLVDQYLAWDRQHLDGGVHALSKLGLELLGSDENIRKAITKITILSGENPFGSQEEKIKDVDLNKLFRYIRENSIDVFKVSLDDIIDKV